MGLEASRQEGTLATWDDARGFGYILPAAGGHRVFAHIHAWPREAARPKLGDVVTFEVERAPDGRIRAAAVRRPFEVVHRAHGGAAPGVVAYLALLAFVALYFVVGSFWAVSPWIAVGYVAMSVLTFLVYAQDKAAARARRWRTKESTLQLLAVLGGWLGAVLAQRLLHHKNRKTSFQVTFWFVVVVNVALFVLLSERASALVTQLVKSLATG